MSGPCPRSTLLIVCNRPTALAAREVYLRSNGIMSLIPCADPSRAAGLLRDAAVGVALLDLDIPDVARDRLLREMHDERPDLPILVIAGSEEIDTAVRCMQAGAFDYIARPAERARLLAVVKRAMEVHSLSCRSGGPRTGSGLDEISHLEAFSEIVTRSREMHALFAHVECIARTREVVLIRGETGVGKELVASAIHKASGLAGMLVTVNTAGLDDAMLSDSLFGHRKGAFTGAEENRDGLVRRASGGTLFLDEIGEIGLASQVKLLRLLEGREYHPLGSDVPLTAECRFVVATSAELEALMAAGRFRRDLYYRLATHEVRVPPLRERRDDLPLLLDYFLDQACAGLGRERVAVSPQVYECLEGYDFPGNVRELRAMVWDAVSRHASRTLPVGAFRKLRAPSGATRPGAVEEITFPTRLPTLKSMADLLVREALRRAEGNQALAAGLVGITPQAISKRMARLRATGRLVPSEDPS